ncbi:hypothetical protein ACJX0J_036026 [Zea mays]
MDWKIDQIHSKLTLNVEYSAKLGIDNLYNLFILHIYATSLQIGALNSHLKIMFYQHLSNQYRTQSMNKVFFCENLPLKCVCGGGGGGGEREHLFFFLSPDGPGQVEEAFFQVRCAAVLCEMVPPTPKLPHKALYYTCRWFKHGFYHTLIFFFHVVLKHFFSLLNGTFFFIIWSLSLTGIYQNEINKVGRTSKKYLLIS